MMTTIEVIETDDGQSIRLPKEVRIAAERVIVRQLGDAVLLEPAKPDGWPAGFFDSICIDDPAFKRPDQGAMPPAPFLG